MSTTAAVILIILIPVLLAILAMPFGIFFSVLKRTDTTTRLHFESFEELLKKQFKAQDIEQKPYTREDVQVTAVDKVVIRGEYFNFGFDKAVLLVHGFRDCPQKDFPYIAAQFAEQGYNILAFNQRAQNISGGRFTTMGMKEQYDIISWIDFLDAKTELKSITVYGLSMGAAATGFASSKIESKKVKALIIDSGFECPIEEMSFTMKSNLAFKPVVIPSLRILAKVFLNIDLTQRVSASLEKNRIPTLFLHGENDIIVPISCSEKNYEHNKSEKLFIKVPNAEHEKAFLTGGKIVQNQIFDFINKYCL